MKIEPKNPNPQTESSELSERGQWNGSLAQFHPAIALGMVLTLIAMGLSGCMTAPSADHEGLGPDIIKEALDRALATGHDHTESALHPGMGWDLREVYQSHLPIGHDRPPEKRPLGPLEVKEDFAFVSLTLTGLAIVDISDPEDPQHVGVFETGTALINDVKVTPDLRWAFIPSDRLPVNMWGRSTDDPESITDDPLDLLDGPLAGVLILDLEDLTEPRLAAIHAAPHSHGYHRLDLHDIDGETYLFAASYARELQHPVGCRMDILRFEETSTGPSLSLVGTYQSPISAHLAACADPDQQGGAHEVVVVPDPLEGFPLAVVSMWEGGVHLVDVSNPEQPELLGYWDEMPFQDGPGDDDGQMRRSNAHDARVFGVEDRRIAVIAPQERFTERQAPLWFVDFTNPSDPELVSKWELPGYHPHNSHDSDYFAMAIQGPRVYGDHIWVAHHHAGLVALNVSTLDKVRDPVIEAWLIPPGIEDRAVFSGWIATPMVYDLAVHGEYVIISDITSGFRIAAWEPGQGLWENRP